MNTSRWTGLRLCPTIFIYYWWCKTARRGRRALQSNTQPCRALYLRSSDFVTSNMAKTFGKRHSTTTLSATKRILINIGNILRTTPLLLCWSCNPTICCRKMSSLPYFVENRGEAVRFGGKRGGKGEKLRVKNRRRGGVSRETSAPNQRTNPIRKNDHTPPRRLKGERYGIFSRHV